MKNNAEQLRVLLGKKQARLKQLQQDVETLSKRVVEAENEEIIATIRSLCLKPEEIASLLQSLQGKKDEATIPHVDKKVDHKQEENKYENTHEDE